MTMSNAVLYATHAQLTEGQIVKVKAWWTYPPGKIIRCEVAIKYKASDEHVEVRPLEGNTHQRLIHTRDITG